MRFYRINETPMDSSDTVFRDSALYKAFGVIVICAMGAIPLILARREEPALLFYVMSATCGLVALVFLSIFIKALGPANWLVRFNVNGMVVKFRSYKNTGLPDEDVVVFELNFNEIAWGRKSVEKFVVPGRRSGDTRHERRVHLDLKVKSAELSELRDQLLAEQRRPAAAGRGKWLDSSVRVVEGEGDGDGEVIRITWRSASSRVTPRLEKALAMLSSSVMIRTEQRSDRDFRGPAADEAEEDFRIAELQAEGRTIEAITLARRYHGLSLSEAKQFVEELGREKEGSSGRGGLR